MLRIVVIINWLKLFLSKSFLLLNGILDSSEEF